MIWFHSRRNRDPRELSSKCRNGITRLNSPCGAAVALLTRAGITRPSSVMPSARPRERLAGPSARGVRRWCYWRRPGGRGGARCPARPCGLSSSGFNETGGRPERLQEATPRHSGAGLSHGPRKFGGPEHSAGIQGISQDEFPSISSHFSEICTRIVCTLDHHCYQSMAPAIDVTPEPVKPWIWLPRHVPQSTRCAVRRRRPLRDAP